MGDKGILQEKNVISSDNSIVLILLLARVKPSEDVLKNAYQIIEAGIDWGRLFNIAAEHGVAPLIYKNICLLNGIPEKTVELFRNGYLLNLKDTVKASCELNEIMHSFIRDGIDAVPVKGIAVATEVYGDLSLYLSIDIDLMVRKMDIYKSIDIMKKVGYLSETKIDPFYFDNNHHVHFVKKGAKPVEIHFRLENKRYFDIPEEFWWNDLREMNFNNYKYKVLSKEKTLIFASIHLFGHGYSCLKFIVSISEMLRVYKDDINWQKLIKDSPMIDAYKPLLLSINTAAALLGAPLTDDISELIKKRSLKEMYVSKKILKDMFKKNVSFAKVMFFLTILNYNAFEIICRMIKWLFPPIKEISCRYDVPLKGIKIYLYYILNPVLLLIRKRK